MKIEIVARESIKPSSPTSKSFNLSLLDQITVPVYTKLYFFYQNTSTDDIEQIVAKRSYCLKSSLSQALNTFYPIAGRIKDQMTVSLEEDDGAEFLEARVDSKLSDYLENPNPEIFLHLVPIDIWLVGKYPHLIVQASFFNCGGLVIGLNISHMVADTCTFTLFINQWANTAFRNNIVNPDFSASLAFPAGNELFLSGEYLRKNVKLNDKTKRFVFTAPNIAALQEKATGKAMNRVTRVAAVTSFLWRIGTKMLMKRAGGSPVTLDLIMLINMRKWLQPPIRDQTFGNLIEFQIVPNDSCDIELPYLNNLLKEQMKKFHQANAKDLDGQQYMERCLDGIKMVEQTLQSDDHNAFIISSWSRFPLYDTDFGWGNPTWVATHNPFPYVTYLLDRRDGTGIEAWVNFPEEEMSVFACDEELLMYATPNPSAL